MSVDWFTVIAQLINFLILVALLRRFLFAPIREAIDARQARIVHHIQEASRREQEASASRRELERERVELQGQQRQLLDEAREQARQRREALEARAREEVERLEIAWRESLQEQQTQALGQLQQDLQRQLLEALRAALEQIASQSLEEAIVQRFILELDRLEPAKREALLAPPQREEEGLVIYSGFPLDEPIRARLIEHLGRRASFAHEPELIAGIELRSGAQALAWNLDVLLEELEEKAAHRLQTLTRAEAPPQAVTGGGT